MSYILWEVILAVFKQPKNLLPSKVLVVLLDHMQKHVIGFAFYCLLWCHQFFYWDWLMKLKNIFHRGLPHEILNIFHRGKNKEITYCYKNYMITCYYIIKTSLFIFCSPLLRSLRLVGWLDYYRQVAPSGAKSKQ